MKEERLAPIAVHEKELQALQEQMAELLESTLVLCTDKGEAMTVPSRPTRAYELMLGSPLYAGRFGQRRMRMCERAKATGAPVLQRWEGAGTALVCVPAKYGAATAGYWMLGPVRVGKAGGYELVGNKEVQAEFKKLADACMSLPRCTAESLRSKAGQLVKLDIQAALEDCGRDGDSQGAEGKKPVYGNKRRNTSEVGLCISEWSGGEVLMANQRFAEIAGVEMEGILGQTLKEIAAACLPGRAPLFIQDPPATEYEGLRGPISWQSYLADIDRFYYSTMQPIRWEDGRRVRLITLLDNTLEQKLRARLERIAYYDELLQLPNEHKLIQELGAEGYGHQYLVCFDIVALRNVNHAYGRKAGDALLRAVAGWVQGQDLPRAKLYRFEGDTFVLRLMRSTLEDTYGIAEEIAARFRYMWQLDVEGEPLELFCGVWVSVMEARVLAVEAGEDTARDIVERTLDAARRKRKLVIYSEAEDGEQRRYNKFELNLRGCVNKSMKGFWVAYQPIVHPGDGRLQAVEALCRWESPLVGNVPPTVFIPMAEQMGMMNQLGAWVLETAVETCKRLGLDRQADFHLSVNVSPTQMINEHFAPRVEQILLRHAWPFERLCLELTESNQFSFTDLTMGTVARLQQQGVQFAIDDFGTGFSSFKNLKDLPVNYIKTEREFLRNIENDEYMQFFFYSMAGLAHAANVRLVAEGVETAGQLQIVAEHGADHVQGFLFSMPLTEKQLEEELQKNRPLRPGNGVEATA